MRAPAVHIRTLAGAYNRAPLSLTSGTRLGPYEIVAPIGAGGMGEVYKATDTRLNRTVAIKVLPRGFAADPERRQRFEREARLVASLSHPHICALHDVGRQDVSSGESVSYLVMEYLEGETLAERLTRGPLPLDETLRAGAATATALGAAHREGIVHRDLKPANVMLTRSGVKLLDFGIAKAIQPPGASTDAVSTKALTVATAAGTTLGTIHYMSPEQLEGRPVDARSDIFALGAVLYEMASGRRAFPGDSYAAIASNILGGQPPPIPASPALDRIVRGCLEKDPDRRWQSAQDVALQLSMAAERDAAVRPASTMAWLPWAIAAAAVILAVAALVWRRAQPASAPATESDTTVTFSMMPPPPPEGFLQHVEGTTMAVSPDGRHIAFVTISRAQRTRVWVRALASLESKPIEGTDGATAVFWSPDSKSVGFFAGGRLKRIDIGGGAAVEICPVRQDIGHMGTWGADGTILFASAEGEAIFQVADSGGTPVALLKPDPNRKERRFAWPSFLADGRRFTFLKVQGDDAGSVMLAGPAMEPKELAALKSNAQYVGPGYLLHVQDGTLLARRMDVDTGQLTGTPTAVADPVYYFYPTGLGNFAASHTGVIAYQSQGNQSRIVWFDRTGKELGVVRPPGGYFTLKLSADERRLLYDRTHPRSGAHDLFLLELDRGAEVQLTSEPGTEAGPRWAANDTIVYSRTTGGPPRLYRRSLTANSDQPIGPEGKALQMPTDTSSDGTRVLFNQRSPRGDFDIFSLNLRDNTVAPLRDSPFTEVDARFSPDGRYVAYASNEGGRFNVYVMPFGSPGARRAVSTEGGTTPRWSPDGRTLYYVAVRGEQVDFAAAPVTAGASLQIGAASHLFSQPPNRRWTDYAVTRDGRFLALQTEVFAGSHPLTVIVNWSPGR
jgi:Tol biopolymer transport system component